MVILAELVNGLKVGIEHVTAEDQGEEGYIWAIVIDILIFRFVFMKTE